MRQGQEPDWAPLLRTVGEEVTGDFMWMFEVELSTGKRLHAYKHIDTRGYVHLDHKGAAYVYTYRERYRLCPIADVLAAVFAPLPGLMGVSARQISASWAAVARLHAGEFVDPKVLADIRGQFCTRGTGCLQQVGAEPGL